MFQDPPAGPVAAMDGLKEDGKEGGERVASVPLIAPNRDGIAYGTVGCHFVLKRERRIT
jgi:hypothetical protein